MFTAAGTIIATIDEVKFAEPKFAKGPNDFDVCIHGTAVSDPNQSDWWRGEVSQNYGKGNFSTMTQAEITMQTLQKIGFEGNDLTKLADQVMGKEVPFTIKETTRKNEDGSETVFHNVKYIGGGGGDVPTEIDAATMQGRLAALFGGGGGAAPAPVATPVAQPTAAPVTAAGNPFAPATGTKSPF